MKTKTKRKNAARGDLIGEIEGDASARRKTQRSNGEIRADDDCGCSIAANSNGAAGESCRDNESKVSSRTKTKRRATDALDSSPYIPGTGGDRGDYAHKTEEMNSTIVAKISERNRHRTVTLKLRNSIDNNLRAAVATAMGYQSGQSEEERKARHAKAQSLIELVEKGGEIPVEHAALVANLRELILTVRLSRNAFDAQLKAIEKGMVALAKQLPVAAWGDSIRGFGIKSLAIIVGETGDLSNFANPDKVQKRLGLAPFNGKMPSTWRYGKEGKLSSEEWEAIGYSPRRRSVMYVIGECLLKQNDGAYRAEYDQQKVRFAEKHPDYSPLRCHRHAMLMATKLLVLHLWKQWNRK